MSQRIEGNTVLIVPETPTEKYIDCLRENARFMGYEDISIYRRKQGVIEVMGWVSPPEDENTVWRSL